MAEEVKKTPKPRKPRVPKAQPAAVVPENVENIEKFEEEVKKVVPVEPIPSEEVIAKPENEEEVVPVEEPAPESISKPEFIESYEEFSSSLEHTPVEIKKLNPYLPDNRSKWVAQIPTKSGRHILFKGSYAKAAKAAENWNISRGLPKKVKEIRSN